MKKKVLGIGIMVLLFSTTFLMADFVNVPPSAFKGWSNTAEYSTLISPGNYFYLYAPSAATAMLAEVHLPDGVKIKNIRLLYYDNDATNDVECVLWRHNMFAPTMDDIFTVLSSGASSTQVRSGVDSTTFPNSHRVVYNNVCNYTIRLFFPAGGTALRVYGVTIEYE
jgi:hypothetical protein